MKNKKKHEETNKHQEYLTKLPKIHQNTKKIKTLYNPKTFYYTLLKKIETAKHHIFIVVLYLEKDEGGNKILESIFQAKKKQPKLKINILVDWHRAQRGRIGTKKQQTNTDWYNFISQKYSNIDIPIYGTSIHNHETFGVLHLKGIIIDDYIIYSGASINNEYLFKKKKYRYDRYHIIQNKSLSETMLDLIKNLLIKSPATKRLNQNNKTKTKKIEKNKIKKSRKILKKSSYKYKNKKINTNQLTITPLIGLGKKSNLNQTIHHLICATKKKLILSTPYFNLPKQIIKNLATLLQKGKKIEIIVGDKTSNDFFTPESQPFKIINTIPYLYENNLKFFIKKFQYYIDNKQMTIRLWKNKNNTFHIKGLWIDDNYQLITGNNFNARAWKLDLENALLLHDPKNKLKKQRINELIKIKNHTQIIYNDKILQNIKNYPKKIQKLILNLKRTRIIYFINQIL